MIVLRALGRFFARIGRWIRDTAWIQPLLIVGGIFAIIFAIPHIIDGVESWFNDSDASNKYYTKYQLSLDNADVASKDNPYIGSSKVDEFFTMVQDGNANEKFGERFFVLFVEEENSSCSNIYDGFKMLQEYWNKNNEFSGLKSAGSFKLYTIYTDSISSKDDETNLFNEVWLNHYSLFETMSAGGYMDKTIYAQNKGYTATTYASKFTAEGSENDCPLEAPTLMYFDYTSNNLIASADQKVKGLSDIAFSVDGSSQLERARTLRDCWLHEGDFKKLKD